jgi:hypothetical protein
MNPGSPITYKGKKINPKRRARFLRISGFWHFFRISKFHF